MCMQVYAFDLFEHFNGPCDSSSVTSAELLTVSCRILALCSPELVSGSTLTCRVQTECERPCLTSLSRQPTTIEQPAPSLELVTSICLIAGTELWTVVWPSISELHVHPGWQET